MVQRPLYVPDLNGVDRAVNPEHHGLFRVSLSQDLSGEAHSKRKHGKQERQRPRFLAVVQRHSANNGTSLTTFESNHPVLIILAPPAYVK